MCSIDGCEKPVEARGWCAAHYLRWTRHGDPQGAVALRTPSQVHADTCEVEGCDRAYYAEGLCRKHYDRKRQAGSPTASDQRFSFDPFSDEFWYELDRSGGPDSCWLWMGARNDKGYGQITRGARNTQQHLLAHRLAYTLKFGQIPNGMLVCHRCDNPPCCNPAHLFLGTHVDNMSDMKYKGRGRGGNQPGEANNYAKLTAEQVDEIRRRYPAERQTDLARKFGVHPSTVSRICSKRRWSVT